MMLVRCAAETAVPSVQPKPRASILLVTLDTTRADAIGNDTPSINALARRGVVFTQAYATVPQTLPSHASMFTGLYPAGHGLRENGRYLDREQQLVTETLRDVGYRTAAFVSAFAVARRFGLGRGFQVYDEDFGDGAERRADATTDRAIAFLDGPAEAGAPLFLWVHYYDPHYPYTPSYTGEIAFMDKHLGRLVQAFEQNFTGSKEILVVADHGEGLGEHGEAQHGNLLYQSTMHVPLVIVTPGMTAGTNTTPVSTRRIFHTIRDLAGFDDASSLRKPVTEVVAGEAMKPFLDYGWQPQVMAVEGTLKAIFSGKTEVYDVIADPKERNNLAATAQLSRGVRATLREYPMPAADRPENLNEEERRKLASLGYIASSAKPVIRPNAPRPADMAHLFDTLDEASALFVRGRYADAIPRLQKILAADPHNLDAALRLATSYSSLGRNEQAVEAFKRAEAIAPDSNDVRTYFGLHYGKTRDWVQAVPLLEHVVAEEPDRLPALEGLALIRERQERFDEALRIREKIATMREVSPAESIRMAELAMMIGNSAAARDAFEKARAAQGASFNRNLDLGVVYLSLRQFAQARDQFDQVKPSNPGYAMALFKRAQVSVLLNEPDAPQRIAAAKTNANATTRELIRNEALFQ
jgi:tetratricopeptide (TPR) repeat protein